MAYQIGQLRDSNFSSSASFFTPVSFTTTDTISVQTSFSDISFQDKGIIPSSFSANRNYYMNFTVHRYEEGTYVDPYDINVNTLNFTVALLSDGATPGTHEIVQTIDSFSVLPYSKGENDDSRKSVNFEIMFTPIMSDYSCIGFILTRNRYDYRGNGEERELLLNINKYGYINNILPRASVSKIGVQSKPGFLMCINGEPIRVGRSGIYEVNNGVAVNFFGIASFDEKFILDYAWNG